MYLHTTKAKGTNKDPLTRLLESIGALKGGHRQVPASLMAILVNLPSEFRLALLACFVVTDGHVDYSGGKRSDGALNRPFGYATGQNLLMSSCGEHPYKSHFSICELIHGLAVAEGQGGRTSWVASNGYGRVTVHLNGLLVKPLCDAVEDVLARKYFQQQFLRMPALPNLRRIEEAPLVQRSHEEMSDVYVFNAGINNTAPMTVVAGNFMCFKLGTGAAETAPAVDLDILGWSKHIEPCLEYARSKFATHRPSDEVLAQFLGWSVETVARHGDLDGLCRRHALSIQGYSSVSDVLRSSGAGIVPIMTRIGATIKGGKERRRFMGSHLVDVARPLSEICIAPVPLADDRWVDAEPYVYATVTSWLDLNIPLTREGTSPTELSTVVRRFVWDLSRLFTMGPVRAVAVVMRVMRVLLPQRSLPDPANNAELERVKSGLDRYLNITTQDRVYGVDARLDVMRLLFEDHETATRELIDKVPVAPLYPVSALPPLEEEDVLDDTVSFLVPVCYFI